MRYKFISAGQPELLQNEMSAGGGIAGAATARNRKSSPAAGKKRTCLFSMIELLVVIAIIAIIAAMLLPALQGVRNSGKSANCIGNLKQLGHGVQFYIDDYDDYLPSGGATNGRFWNWYLMAYFMPNRADTHESSDIFRCPAFVFPADDIYLAEKKPRRAVSYGYNTTCNSPSYSVEGRYNVYRKLSAIYAPAERPLIADFYNISQLTPANRRPFWAPGHFYSESHLVTSARNMLFHPNRSLNVMTITGTVLNVRQPIESGQWPQVRVDLHYNTRW